jgi:hypothetical protein
MSQNDRLRSEIFLLYPHLFLLILLNIPDALVCIYITLTAAEKKSLVWPSRSG